MNTLKSIENHSQVPPDYYFSSISTNLGQRFWHQTRFRHLSSMITPDPTATVLDIGSADGAFSEVIYQRLHPKSYTGIDVLQSSVDYAQDRFAHRKNMVFTTADAHHLPYKKQSFTAVFCLEVLEHIFNPKLVLKEIYRVLCPGGYLVILIPLETPLFRLIWYLWTLGKGRIWKHAHVNQYNRSSLKSLLQKSGFTISREDCFMAGMLYLVKAKKI